MQFMSSASSGWQSNPDMHRNLQFKFLQPPACGEVIIPITKLPSIVPLNDNLFCESTFSIFLPVFILLCETHFCLQACRWNTLLGSAFFSSFLFLLAAPSFFICEKRVRPSCMALHVLKQDSDPLKLKWDCAASAWKRLLCPSLGRLLALPSQLPKAALCVFQTLRGRDSGRSTLSVPPGSPTAWAF